MRGTRSLGLALIAASLGGVPAIAQTNAPAPINPATTAPANRAEAPATHQNATPPANQQAASNADTSHNQASNQTNSTSANSAPENQQQAAKTPPENQHQATNNTAANNTPPANAQADNTATNKAPPANAEANNAKAEPNNTAVATNAKNAASGKLEKYNNDWRSSKLVGATVYDSKGDDIGTIDDLLMDDSGKVTKAVIATGGGVLGIGSKLVSVDFDQLKFEPSKQSGGALPSTEAPARPAANGPTGNTIIGSNNSGHVANAPSGTVNANKAATHPEYYSVVLPNATKDSLAKEQTFKYASKD